MTMMGVQGGVVLGWVFAVGGGVRVRVHWDGQGACGVAGMSQDGSG